MTNNPLIPQSKLPQLGTTIFTQMSALAQQHEQLTCRKAFLILMVRAICRSARRTTLPGGKPIRAYDWRAGLARGDCSENGTSVWLSTGCR